MPESSNQSPDETSPLLGQDSATDHGTLERGNANNPSSHENDADVPVAEELDNWHLAVVLASIYPGVFLAAIDATLIATLTAPISSSFRSLSLLSWLASAYLISNAACQPLSGRLTDIFSRRTGLIFSNIFFALGNLICGLATKQWVIITGRVVAGIGGGGLTAIATFVGSDLVPLRKRGVVQGIGNICFSTGSALGGVAGGWINDVWGWRVAFLIQVPFTIVSAIAVYFVVNIPVKETAKSQIRRVDFLGASTLCLSLVLFLLGVNSGGNVVPWTHPLVLVTLPLSAVFLALFIYVEEKVAAEPIIPVRLLLNRTVASACLTNWFTTMAVFTLLFYIPIFFQVKGLSTTQAGARLVPQSIGAATGSLGSGLIMKSTGRYYYLNVGALSLFLLSSVLINTMNLSTPTWPPFLYFLLGGIGYGGMLTITLLALIGAVDHAHQAVITSASYAFRSTGSTLGVTIASAIFQNVLQTSLWSKFGGRDDAREIIGRLKDSFDEIDHLPLGWKEGVLESYMQALRGVFMSALAMALLGSVISLFMREHTLHLTLARK